MADVPKLNGVWLYNKERSDDDSEHLRISDAGMLLKQATKAFKGLELKIVPGESFTFITLTVIPMLKMTEKYPLTGEPVNFKRRDARKGTCTSACKWVPGSNEILLEYSWDGYLEGNGSDLMQLVSDDELVVTTTFKNQNGEIVNKKVYNRKK